MKKHFEYVSPAVSVTEVNNRDIITYSEEEVWMGPSINVGTEPNEPQN